MFVHPQFNPVALQLGPLAIRWYGLMYLFGFAAFLGLGRNKLRRNPNAAAITSSKDVELAVPSRRLAWISGHQT